LYGNIYSVVGVNVHDKIQPLLSLRYGLSSGAKKLGEVMWPSLPLSFSVPSLRCRDLSLPVAPIEGWLVKVSSRLRSRFSQVRESIGDIVEEVFDRTATDVVWNSKRLRM
jgi:hypothetical protein